MGEFDEPFRTDVVGEEDPIYSCPQCGVVVRQRADLTFRCYDCMWESG